MNNARTVMDGIDQATSNPSEEYGDWYPGHLRTKISMEKMRIDVITSIIAGYERELAEWEGKK